MASNHNRNKRAPTGREKVQEEYEVFKTIDRADNDIDGVESGHGDGSSPPKVNYRNLSWFRASFLLAKVQLGLGILSIPFSLQSLGAVPGGLIIVILSLITTYGGHVFSQFRSNHPGIYSIDDVGQIMFGRLGREIYGGAYMCYMVLGCGSGLLSISIALNALSNNAICTVWFVFVAAIAVALAGSIQTLGRISWLTLVAVFCIVASTLTVTIAVTQVSRPAAAPPTGPFTLGFYAWPKTSETGFKEAMLGVSNIVVSLCGTPAFLPIISEMKKPGDYHKSLYLAQGFVGSVYLALGLTVYAYCGQFVASPALGSAGGTVKKVAYGVALPGLWIGAVLYCHIPAKLIFVRALRNSQHLQSNTLIHWLSWEGSILCVIIIAFITANAIPFFSDLLGLIGALFGVFLCITAVGTMWLYDHPSFFYNLPPRSKPVFTLTSSERQGPTTTAPPPQGDQLSPSPSSKSISDEKAIGNKKKDEIQSQSPPAHTTITSPPPTAGGDMTNNNNYPLPSSFQHKLEYLFNIFLVTIGVYLMIGGTYAAVQSIRDDYKKGTVGSPFSCADNSA